ncbi:MAG: hypothetical protein C0432_01380 [Candidatus Puniceispirillum sp.]|nr:hypothetical protein [Candidatus Pelagibacter sp.]MBA4282933.1 hypothetical protein [Candidatus Puniceispirillum sp.]
MEKVSPMKHKLPLMLCTAIALLSACPESAYASEKTETSFFGKISNFFSGIFSSSKETSKSEAVKADIKQESSVTTSKDSSTEDMQIAARFPDKTVISVQDVNKLTNAAPDSLQNQYPQAKIYQLMLMQLVTSKLLNDAAVQEGIDKSDDYIKKSQDAHNVVKTQLVLTQEIDKILTDAVLKEQYDDFIKVMPKEDEYQIQHILLSDESKANEILNSLKKFKGEILKREFADAVQKHSADAQSKKNNGIVGWLPKQKLNNDAFNEVASGELVGKVVKVFNEGYSVIFIKGKRPAQPPTFEQAKAELKQVILPQYALQVIEKLRKDMGVTLTGLDKQHMELPALPPMPKLGADPKNLPEMPKPKDFSAVNEKDLDNTMVVAEMKDGSKITLQEVRDSIADLPDSLKAAPFHEQFTPALLKLADMKILDKIAKDRKIIDSPEFKERFEKAKKTVLSKLYMDKKLENRITQKMIKETYDSISDLFSKDEMAICLRHVMVKSKDKAQDLLNKILKGGGVKKFEEYIASESIDEQSKKNNGKIGCIPQKDLKPEIAEILFKKPQGTFVEEPIQMAEEGYSIVRVEEKKKIQPPTIEQLKPQLFKLAAKKESEKILRQVVKESKVEMFDSKGNKIDINGLLNPKNAEGESN